MKNYYWTFESWGADYPPENADEIIVSANNVLDQYVNSLKDEDLTYDQIDSLASTYSDILWERYCKNGFLWEVVEVCPHCDAENEWKNLNPIECNYVARCQHCGELIMLCDECFHSDDNPERKCDWHECDGCSSCFRATIKK